LGVKTAVEIDGGIDPLHDFRRSGSVAAAPHGVAAHGDALREYELTKGPYLLLPLLTAVAFILVLQTALADKGPPRTGWMKKFTVIENPYPASPVEVTDGSGRPIRLSQFAGRVVLVNFWATWCTPCVREMPGLDKLQERLGGPDFVVVAINEDRDGIEVAKPFLKKLKTPNLELYIDEGMKLMRALNVRGMPTSFLLNRSGEVVGKLEGIAEWSSTEAESLIRYYLKRSTSALGVGKIRFFLG